MCDRCLNMPTQHIDWSTSMKITLGPLLAPIMTQIVCCTTSGGTHVMFTRSSYSQFYKVMLHHTVFSFTNFHSYDYLYCNCFIVSLNCPHSFNKTMCGTPRSMNYKNLSMVPVFMMILLVFVFILTSD